MIIACDNTVDGKKCTGLATHVYRSNWKTKLICDECTVRYDVASPYGVTHVIEPVFLAEVKPARERLLNQLTIAHQAYDKLVAKSKARDDEARRAVTVFGVSAATMLLLVLLGTFVTWWMAIPASGVGIGSMTLLARNARKRVARAEEEIDRKFGFPEMSL